MLHDPRHLPHLSSFPTRRSSDLVFGNSAGFPPIDQLMDYGQNYPWPDSYIYLGGPQGFSKDRRISLPTKGATDRKSTRLNSSHLGISYAVFCLKKKKKLTYQLPS